MNDAHATARRARGGDDDTKKRIACRFGYAAHGTVYLLIGVFAIDAAIGGGHEAEG